MNKNIIYKEIEFAGRKLTLETGKLATMTNMSVKATYGDTVLLVTVVSGGYDPESDYFPLNIVYLEKYYAGGLIKNSRFQKRDGKGSDDAIIAGRVIDHAVRPLFPSDFSDEVQLVVTVLSLDQDADPRFLSMIAASAAFHASNIPWAGPMASIRLGYVDGNFALCPSKDVLHNKSELDMIVSFVGDDRRFLALEAEANILPEEKIMAAVDFARENTGPLFDFINDFAKEVNPNNEKYTYTSTKPSEEIYNDVEKIAGARIKEAMQKNLDKDEMQLLLSQINEEVTTGLEGKYKKVDMLSVVELIKKYTMQSMILETGKRPDGREIKEIRPLSAEVGVLPRTHGSALFSRGLTQVMTIATLGSPSSELLVQDMYGESSKKFLHYYNFPPFSSGETGKIGYPKNREIGHGMIAENGLRPVIPSQKDFPYMILLVSETMSSSGSTSMASTCGSTLALMDAGVPIKDMVAGIGVGLIADEGFKKHLIMTDLAYMEDAFGLLDFKMTGTRTGVTAIQCDMKSKGIPFELLPKIIEQSKEGRAHVLDVMEATISKPRAEVSVYAPKSATVMISPDKIGLVIGSGGKTIKEIQEKTNTEIAIDDDGTVVVSGIIKENVEKAASIVANLVKDIEPGEIYDGVVEEVVEFGAFVEILPGKNGLLHISEISNEYVDDASKFLKAGDTVKVKVLEVSRDGKISLSKKILEEGADQHREPRPRFGGRPNDRSGRGGHGPRGDRGDRPQRYNNRQN